MSKQKVAVLMLIVFIMVPFQYLRMKWLMKKDQSDMPNPVNLRFTTQK